MLASGIPVIAEYRTLEESADFRRLEDYSRKFQIAAGRVDGNSRWYSARWVDDPFQQWSRRWEYTYVLQRLESWWAHLPKSLEIADAGSGFTFFPFYLLELRPDARLLCIDANQSAGKAIDKATHVLGFGPQFALQDLEKLDQGSKSLDAVFSISVIEHTEKPEQVVEEIHRVLKPGGLFVCTFDVSFEKGSPMHVPRVERLVNHLHDLFDAQGAPGTGITQSCIAPDRVTTTWIASRYPERLPWRHPRLVWLYDALRGRFRPSLHRPMTFYCGTFIKP